MSWPLREAGGERPTPSIVGREGIGEADGKRYYFGETKSLKDRHRKDDPLLNLVRDSLYTLHRQDEDEYGGAVMPPSPPTTLR